ncbi:hypothetical protein SPRG_02653 [Saprolegnia parasitica CBS 223.65]|uniref:KIF-binding protein n=1 Tax=Saprolegnia parasitica (strain CBS 223.65) TaxID=695850 RepID=A0A067D2G6_SAPPC|nr:hypothetical protein SPRG_02653 [Saprolegnia parasitica CBS 223.65]KDO32961.1 hypothetical protein SPRG_02653 [Saprolegnia parasitica CBS 223.65]|eukprot:XP_012196607.1 hypothetical protein SPRG_02653 [Saprolegnia parasitica CBS 223.65]
MTDEQMGNTLCMWGTAISRIATENDDATLAEAAVDKFEQALQLLGKDEMGPYGMALYGSTSMIVATEKQDRQVLEAALQQFQMAVDMDTPEAFESHFQYAKALKEGSHLVQHLLENGADEDETLQSPRQLQEKALGICKHLLQHHADVLGQPTTSSDDVLASAAAGDDEEEDCVTTEDMSEVILLQAQLMALLSVDDPMTIFTTFKQSYDIFGDNYNALIEMNAFLIQVPKGEDAMTWVDHLAFVATEFKKVLLSIEFDTTKCDHVIRFCMEDELDAFDERAPKLLDCLGRNLLEQLKCHREKQDALAAETILTLRTAHHLHDQFGCYPLATLFAHPLYVNAAECHTWMETCESYGVLDEEFNAAEFASMESEVWYQQFVAGGKLKPTEATVVE